MKLSGARGEVEWCERRYDALFKAYSEAQTEWVNRERYLERALVQANAQGVELCKHSPLREMKHTPGTVVCDDCGQQFTLAEYSLDKHKNSQ